MKLASLIRGFVILLLLLAIPPETACDLSDAGAVLSVATGEGDAGPASVNHSVLGKHRGSLKWELKDSAGLMFDNATVSDDHVGLMAGPGEWELLSPCPRESHTIVWDGLRGQLILFGGIGDSGALNDNWAYSAANDTWTRLSPGPAKARHTAVWDSVRDRMLVFGGTDGTRIPGDVWTYDPSADKWEMSPHHGPQLQHHAAVWDPGNGRMLVFGGEVSGSGETDELWAYDPAMDNWTQRAKGPSARCRLGAVWDPVREQMIIGSGDYYEKDTWAYTPANDTWTLKAKHPGIIYDYGAVWDTRNNQMLVSGGRETYGAVIGELWSYDPATDLWVNVFGGLPDPRYWHSVAWDPSGERMFLFGGHDHSNTDDLWAYYPFGNYWEARWGGPPSSDHTAVWDDFNDQMLVFGGWTGQTRSYNFTTGRWTERAHGPGLRNHTAVWDSWHAQMLVYGGGGDATWAYDAVFDEWVPKAQGPPARSGSSAVWDDGKGRMLVFGGVPPGASYGAYNDVWSYWPANDTWQNLSPAGPCPYNRSEHSAVWDPQSDRMIIFGGRLYDITYQVFKDAWAYDPAQNGWSRLMDAPHGMDSHSAIWDPVHSEMLVYGGAIQGSGLNNTWAYVPGNNSWHYKKSATTTLAGHPAIWNPIDREMAVPGGHVPLEDVMQLWTFREHFQVFGEVMSQPVILSNDWLSTFELDFNATIPPGTGLDIQARASDDSLSWGAWQPFETGSLPSLQGRYVQWKARLSTNDLDVSPGLFNVTVGYILNIAPNAYVDPVPLHHHNSVVRLSGWGGDGDGDPLTFLWTQTAGPAVVLENAASPNASFFAAVPGKYAFSLVVNDSLSDSLPEIVTLNAVNWEPVASAGPDITVFRGERVFLRGLATDEENDPLTFRWGQVSGPPVSLENADTANASFVARPMGACVFSLIANDSFSDSRPAFVNVSVLNWPPSASAGCDTAVHRLGRVVLDGAGFDTEGEPLTYRWNQTSGPPIDLEGNDSPAAVFVPVEPGVYGFSLVVRDPYDASPPALVNITALDWLPNVTVDPELFGYVRDRIFLCASAEDGDGDPLTYHWDQKAGPAVQVVNRTRPVAYFVAPDVGNYTFTVSVNDSYGESIRTVNVTARGPNLPPRFLSQPPRRATVGKEWYYEIRFVDDDAGDRLDLALSKGPEGMVLDSTTLHWTPRKGQAGEQVLQLSLSDGRDAIYQNWTVTVEEESSWGALSNGPVIAGVVILIVVAAVAVVVAVRRRRAGGHPPK